MSGLILAILLLLAVLFALSQGVAGKDVLITGVPALVLVGNVILFLRNKKIDRLSKNLCLESGRYYMLTKNGVTSDGLPIQLHYKGEQVMIGSDEDKHLKPTKYLTFQVLTPQDWKAIQQFRSHQASGYGGESLFIYPVAS
jgi:hypothetical protein